MPQFISRLGTGRSASFIRAWRAETLYTEPDYLISRELIIIKSSKASITRSVQFQ
jgi:hypothetical protein